MSVELTLLFYSALLLLLQISAPAIMAILANGIPWGLSNRDTPPTSSDMYKRALRARNNLLENLIVFAILILVASAAGVSTENTVFGAQLFFWGRIAHFITYLAGIIYARTLAWLVSFVGMILIALDIWASAGM
jgi:uncharacterized MAPEG superfamily protein